MARLIIIIAPPGAGKGTQSNLIADKFGLYHLETSRIIEKKIAEADPNDEIINQEKKIRSTGGLMTPEIIYSWLMEEVRKQAAEGKGLILSGSPRTEYEVINEMPEFERLFGRDNIKIFYLSLSLEESINRNSKRRICQANRHPIPNFPEFSHLIVCPQDGSPLITRDIDKADVIATRYQAFKDDTSLVLDYFEKNGYSIFQINGEQPIEKVFTDISEYLK
jgi:adenylate kinase